MRDVFRTQGSPTPVVTPCYALTYEHQRPRDSGADQRPRRPDVKQRLAAGREATYPGDGSEGPQKPKARGHNEGQVQLRLLPVCGPPVAPLVCA